MPRNKDLSSYGIEDYFTVQMPKKERLFNASHLESRADFRTQCHFLYYYEDDNHRNTRTAENMRRKVLKTRNALDVPRLLPLLKKIEKVSAAVSDRGSRVVEVSDRGWPCHEFEPIIPKDPRSLVYADKPQTLDHLEDNIRRVIADIRPQMLEKVIENWTSGWDYIRASRGSPMPEIIFKISKNFIDADSDDENDMNNAAPVPTSSEMKHIIKTMRSYLDTHSNGEMNDIEQFDAEKDNAKKNR
ncbi:hypothetical protein TNCV_4775951 [Trichonephila clavipes]|nr:hypothetical protein TNCV_4775951 [Trichonephila clavipes]